MSATYRATCQSTPTTLPTLGGDIGTCAAGPQIPHAGTSHDEPAVDPPDPTPIRPLIEPKEPARSHPSVELIPVLEQHAHLHEVKPCRVSIPSTVRGSRKNKKYFYSRSMRVSNLKSPFHLDRKAPPEQTAPSKPHFSFSTQKLQQNDFLAEPLVQKDVEIASRPSQFSGRAKHRWTVVDPPHLQFVIGHWQRSIPPEPHSPAELLDLYHRRHTRTGKTEKRPHTTPRAVVCSPRGCCPNHTSAGDYPGQAILQEGPAASADDTRKKASREASWQATPQEPV